AMLKIDRSYLAELEKLKVKYTKAGNLDAANAIVALIERVRENLIGTILTSGSWRYQMENGAVVSRTFVNRELLAESGRRYAFDISKDTVRIDWGSGAFEEMRVDLDHPQRIDGINDKGGKFKYFR